MVSGCSYARKPNILIHDFGQDCSSIYECFFPVSFLARDEYCEATTDSKNSLWSLLPLNCNVSKTGAAFTGLSSSQAQDSHRLPSGLCLFVFGRTTPRTIVWIHNVFPNSDNPNPSIKGLTLAAVTCSALVPFKHYNISCRMAGVIYSHFDRMFVYPYPTDELIYYCLINYYLIIIIIII